MHEMIVLQVVIGLVAFAVVTAVLMHLARQYQLGRGPARDLLSRGERLSRQLAVLLADRPAWQELCVDAKVVVEQLRSTAGRVAELDHALAQLADPEPPAAARLRELREAHLTSMTTAVEGLEAARAEVAQLIADDAPPVADGDPVRALDNRLAGLREGLAELRGLPDPEVP